jgi:CBS domain containing-hemolysin-like protein
MSEDPVPLYLLLVFICLVLSAFFSGTEATLLSVQRVRLHGMLQRGVPGARLVARIVERPDRFLPTILLGNNLANTAAAALGTSIALTFISSDEQAVIVATVAVTLLLLVFGEVIPKTIATRQPERLSLLVVRPLEGIRYLLFPLVFLLQLLSRAVVRLFGGGGWREMVTEEELKAMISLGRAAGTVETQEAEMLERVFRFGDRQVREVITPRTESVVLEKGTLVGAFLQVYSRYPYSRFPVYEGGLDNVVGVLSMRDVLRALADNKLDAEDDVTALIRPAFFVPEYKLVSELLTEFQASGNSMAIVVDEFGGVDGLVTLTQLVEVVVGPLAQQEGIPSEDEVRVLDENTFEVGAGMRVEEVNQRLELSFPDGEYETVAGLILDVLGHIPQEGEALESGGARMKVTLMRGVKIESVLITRSVPPTQAEVG